MIEQATLRADPAAPVRRSRVDPVLLVATGALGVLAFLLVRSALVDDAYITVDYARNLAFGLHWGLIAAETANSATSPLNVVVLAAATLVVRDGVVAVGVVFVLVLVLTAHWLSRIAADLGLSRITPWAGVAALAVNPLLLSTVGLESYLAIALITGLVRFGVAGRAVALGVVGGLLELTRPDLVVPVVVAAVGFLGVGRPSWRAAGSAALVAVPWHLFSWFALGSAVPDTLVMKAGQQAWAGFGFGTGWRMYLNAAPWFAGPAFAIVPVAVAAVLAVVLFGRVRGARRAVLVTALATAAHFAAYALLAPPPYHWYYGPLLGGATICAALAAGVLVERSAPAGGVVLALVAAVVAVSAYADLRVTARMPWDRAVIGTNWAEPVQYERIGRDVGAIVGDDVVESPGEIGTLVHYCDCSVVDAFSDRGRVIPTVLTREAASGRLGRALIGLNYRNLDRDDPPLPVRWRLVYERGVAPSGPNQWPVNHWAEGPGRMVLLPV